MKSRALIAAVILGLWLGSMFTPVADTATADGQRDTVSGLAVLAMGWLGPLIGQFAWFANLVLPAALLLAARSPSRTGRFGLVLAGLLGLFAVNAMFWSDIPVDSDNPIVRYRSGYWLWLAAVIAGALWVGIIAAKERAELRRSET